MIDDQDMPTHNRVMKSLRIGQVRARLPELLDLIADSHEPT